MSIKRRGRSICWQCLICQFLFPPLTGALLRLGHVIDLPVGAAALPAPLPTAAVGSIAVLGGDGKARLERGGGTLSLQKFFGGATLGGLGDPPK
jgi:hypothetical protein